MILTITITPEIIKRGEAGSCLMCPIALAAIEAIKDTHFMFVGAFVDYLILQDMSNPGIYEIEIDYPDEGKVLVHQFDNKVEVQPITFTLDTDMGRPVSTNG